MASLPSSAHDVPLSSLFPPPAIDPYGQENDDDELSMLEEEEDDHQQQSETGPDATQSHNDKSDLQDGPRSRRQRRRHSSSTDSSSSDSTSTDEETTDTRAKRQRTRSTRGHRGGANRVSAPRQQTKGDVGSTSSSRRVDRLISEALRSHRREQNRDIIKNLRAQLMTMLRSAVAGQGGAPPCPNNDEPMEDEEHEVETQGTTNTGSGLSPEYLSTIRRAHKKDADKAKFDSPQHRSMIKSLLNNVTDIRDLSLVRIPSLDSEYGMDQLPIASGDTTLDSDSLKASPNKTIPEAMYSALTDSYSACTLLKAFLNKLIPYITIPYLGK